MLPAEVSPAASRCLPTTTILQASGVRQNNPQTQTLKFALQQSKFHVYDDDGSSN
jgi:hypothetical protein